MKKIHLSTDFDKIFFILILLFSSYSFSQTIAQPKNLFWEKVQYGGGLGVGLGSGYTDIMVAPSAIYNFNQYVALGAGVQVGYLSSKNYYTSLNYGGSIISLLHPIPEVQLSVELEQLRVNTRYKQQLNVPPFSDNFWNAALFLGAGYRNGNVTIGGRYDVLYKKNRSLNGSAFMPFVRFYF